MWWIVISALWIGAGIVGTWLWARYTALEQDSVRQGKWKFRRWCVFTTAAGAFNLLAYFGGMMDHSDAVRAAQKIARQQGLRVGDMVCHPKEQVRLEYQLAYIDENGVATLVIPAEKSKTGQDVERHYSINELFTLSAFDQELGAARGKILG